MPGVVLKNGWYLKGLVVRGGREHHSVTLALLKEAHELCNRCEQTSRAQPQRKAWELAKSAWGRGGGATTNTGCGLGDRASHRLATSA